MHVPSPVLSTEMPEICLLLRNRPCRTTVLGPGLTRSGEFGSWRMNHINPQLYDARHDPELYLRARFNSCQVSCATWAHLMDLAISTFRGHITLDYGPIGLQQFRDHTELQAGRLVRTDGDYRTAKMQPSRQRQ
ncbi:hypothetical protein Tco_0128808 [Tanacetum coccineum]|uniref:Uncharacterized protein n=1 Tax=Tanacetum coccineum TaxID=301880 RepID=A0ABQ5DPM0_9ASTR